MPSKPIKASRRQLTLLDLLVAALAICVLGRSIGIAYRGEQLSAIALALLAATFAVPVASLTLIITGRGRIALPLIFAWLALGLLIGMLFPVVQ